MTNSSVTIDDMHEVFARAVMRREECERMLADARALELEAKVMLQESSA